MICRIGKITFLELVVCCLLQNVTYDMFRIFVICKVLKFAESVRWHDTQRTGLYAGWEIEFRLPEPLLIENILMKLKLMLNNVCPARTTAWLCN
jgi:hypothetical protein